MEFMNIGYGLAVLFTVLAMISGYWGAHVNSSKSNDEYTREANTAISAGQQGGVTAGKIEVNNTYSNYNKNKDAALIYKTEISHFLNKFRTCLHWMLPLGENVDEEIDEVFKYANGLTGSWNLDKLSKELAVKIFSEYDFSEKMPNYSGAEGYHPTGYNNILGILKHYDEQLNALLNKYGSSMSSNLSTQIEYMQRSVQSVITGVRIDLQSKGKLSEQTIESIASLLVLMKEDEMNVTQNYLQGLAGGYPVAVGKVTKSDSVDGEMIVETQFSDY